jgi:hypothetical protein
VNAIVAICLGAAYLVMAVLVILSGAGYWQRGRKP